MQYLPEVQKVAVQNHPEVQVVEVQNHPVVQDVKLTNKKDVASASGYEVETTSAIQEFPTDANRKRIIVAHQSSLKVCKRLGRETYDEWVELPGPAITELPGSGTWAFYRTAAGAENPVYWSVESYE